MKPVDYVRKLYKDHTPPPCPFTEAELEELPSKNEMLVYLPGQVSANRLVQDFGFKSSVDFEADKLVKYAMPGESHWFVCSASKTPELIYKSAVTSRRAYEDEGLHGMDVRRYLAFAATFRMHYGEIPDQAYWSYLTSGAYDRSGISVMGFDAHGVISHHGWMKDFKAKFVGSRYVVLAPRLEITPETRMLPRAYRGGGRSGREADMD